MSPQDFLAHFHETANAPGGVARLRELVLSLAGQGRLCEQDLSDEPASTLMKKVDEARAELLGKDYPNADEARSQMRKQAEQRLPEGLTTLPHGWVWATLMQSSLLIVDCHNKTAPYTDRGIRLVRTTNVRNGRLNFNEPKFVSEETYKRWSARCQPEPGDILITREAPMGEVCIIPPETKLCMGQRMMLVRLAPGTVDPRFMLLSLMDANLMARVQDKPIGATVQHLRVGGVETLLVGLPPLAEQKRIVAKVEELMALCDALEAQQQERARLLPRLSRATHTRLTDSPTQPHLDSLFTDLASISPEDMRRTIINLAFQGNLTQQLPNDDPADAIIQRLSAARSRHETKGGLRSRIQLDMPLQSSSAPFGIPNSWKWGRLHEVAWIKHGYAFDSESFSDTPTDYVVATPGNFFERGGFRDRGVRTKYFAGKVDPEFIFQAGDLIIPMTEQAPGLLGSPAFIPDDGKTYIHNQRLGKLCFYSEEVSPWFAYWFFNTPFFRSELSRTCTGMKVRHTSPSRVLAVPFPICSLAEQRRIVAKVDELMALVDTLEAQQQEKSRLAETFAQTCIRSLVAS